MATTARLALGTAYASFAASLFPCAAFLVGFLTKENRAGDLVFKAAGIVYGVLCAISLALIVLGRGDGSETRKKARLWWELGVCALLVQAVAILFMRFKATGVPFR